MSNHANPGIENHAIIRRKSQFFSVRGLPAGRAPSSNIVGDALESLVTSESVRCTSDTAGCWSN